MHQYANLLLLNKETQEVQDSFANETQFVNIFTTNFSLKTQSVQINKPNKHSTYVSQKELLI